MAKKREHGVYKYVYNDEVIYVGKTDAENGFKNRINAHKKEHELFNKSEIYIHKCKDKTETDSLETILINAYKPKLNKAKLYEYRIIPPELNWIPWEIYANKNKIVRFNDVLSCIESNNQQIKIGDKYRDLGEAYLYLNSVSRIIDNFKDSKYNTVEFYDSGHIAIGGRCDFPTETLLLYMKSQIDYFLDNYAEFKHQFLIRQYRDIQEVLSKYGFILYEDLMQNINEQIL